MDAYEKIESDIEVWSDTFQKEHGHSIRIMINPEFFTKKYTPDVKDETVKGLDSWVKATLTTLDTFSKNPSKLEVLKKLVTIIVFMGYDKDLLKDEIERDSGKGGGLSIIQSVASFTEGAPSNFSKLLEKAIFEPTKKEIFDANLEKIKDKRGKITVNLSTEQKQQIVYFAMNTSLIDMGAFMMSFAQLGEQLAKAMAHFVAKPFAEMAKESTIEIDKKIEQISIDQKDTIEQLSGARDQMYQEKNTMAEDLMAVITDDLILEAQKLIMEGPKVFPRLDKEMSKEELFKLVIIRTSFLTTSAAEKTDPNTAKYFEQISNWVKLMSPK